MQHQWHPKAQQCFWRYNQPGIVPGIMMMMMMMMMMTVVNEGW
jgi:hypothetical protein